MYRRPITDSTSHHFLIDTSKELMGVTYNEYELTTHVVSLSSRYLAYIKSAQRRKRYKTYKQAVVDFCGRAETMAQNGTSPQKDVDAKVRY